jgi:hypothetical protein
MERPELTEKYEVILQQLEFPIKADDRELSDLTDV